MLPAIKSEIRKLFTVRSTYLLIAIALVLTIIFAFYFEGYRGNTGSPASELAPTALQEIVANGAGMGALFVSIIAILFMAHEWRYNTIAYTLTLNTRRTKVLLSKFVVIAGFAVAFGLVAVSIAIGGYMFGLSLRDATLPAQEFDVWSQLGRVAFYYLGYALIGTIIAVAVRGLVAAISTWLVYSIMAEPLLSLLLKENSKYLPVTALDISVGAAYLPVGNFSPSAAMLAVSGYLLIGIIIVWLLFVKRDAV